MVGLQTRYPARLTQQSMSDLHSPEKRKGYEININKPMVGGTKLDTTLQSLPLSFSKAKRVLRDALEDQELRNSAKDDVLTWLVPKELLLVK